VAILMTGVRPARKASCRPALGTAGLAGIGARCHTLPAWAKLDALARGAEFATRQLRP
jgi:hypothetical protein